MLSDGPPATTRRPSGPISRRDLVANSILQIDMDNELDTFTADIDCLADSSDEEEDYQPPAARGKNEGSQEGVAQSKRASESSGKADTSSEKKERKDAEEGEDDEEEVSHSAVFGAFACNVLHSL